MGNPNYAELERSITEFYVVSACNKYPAHAPGTRPGEWRWMGESGDRRFRRLGSLGRRHEGVQGGRPRVGGRGQVRPHRAVCVRTLYGEIRSDN